MISKEKSFSMEIYKKHTPKHQSHKKKTHKKFLVIILLLLIFTAIGLGVWWFFLNEISPDSQETLPPTEMENIDNSIAIPGYEGLTLKADTKRQEISLKNPAQNNCYFVITLYLEDGTELWKSDYIKAGDVSKPINLNRKLSAGNYSAKLKYDCFALNKEKTPLNGAEIKLTLRVK